jgi:hypothetical protein
VPFWWKYVLKLRDLFRTCTVGQYLCVFERRGLLRSWHRSTTSSCRPIATRTRWSCSRAVEASRVYKNKQARYGFRTAFGGGTEATARASPPLSAAAAGTRSHPGTYRLLWHSARKAWVRDPAWSCLLGLALWPRPFLVCLPVRLERSAALSFFFNYCCNCFFWIIFNHSFYLKY